MRKLFGLAFLLASAASLRAGVTVDAQTGTRIPVCTNELTFAWDWNWDWIPTTAQTATVVAKDTGGGLLYSNTVSRPVSSVTWDLSTLVEPVVQSKFFSATLSFPCPDKFRASRTANYELRAGSFRPRVRACETNSAAWRRFELPTTFDFDARWFRGVSMITYIQWKDTVNTDIPLYTPNNLGGFPSSARGFLTVPEGYLPQGVYLASIHQWNTRLAECVICNQLGMMIFIR